MKSYSFYDLSTGVFSPFRYTGITSELPGNTPPGFAPMEGNHDRLRVRVNIETGKLEPYQPPAPADTEWATYSWDADAWAWAALPTDAALARDARAERDRRLSACDWVVARAVERAEPVTAVWATYREALRDIPEQPGFPRTISWPPLPSA